MEIIWFTLAGAMLYLMSDWLLRQIEAWRGALLPHRSLVFFAIILTLSLLAFQLINLMGEGVDYPGATPSAETSQAQPDLEPAP